MVKCVVVKKKKKKKRYFYIAKIKEVAIFVFGRYGWEKEIRWLDLMHQNFQERIGGGFWWSRGRRERERERDRWWIEGQ